MKPIALFRTRPLSIAFLVLSLLAHLLPAADSARPPNVVLILADDLGYDGLSCYGSPIFETPHIDRLAAGGQKWTRAYAGMATCAPSRSVLMTGQYTPRTGVWRVQDRFAGDENHIRFIVPELHEDLALEKITIAEAFKAAGYRTAMFGKWHLGRGDFHPLHQGFDEAIVAQSSHFNFKVDPDDGQDIPDGTYDADYMTDKALDFMESCRKEDEKFFLYMPYYLIHKPLQAKADLEAKYREKLGNTYDPEVATIAAMTESLDASVGRIYAYLKSHDMLADTILVFTSDNGGYQVKGPVPNLFNLPYRSVKGQLYEGGIRVPAIFHWPGHVAAGTETGEVLHFVDLYPTLIELAGASLPEAFAPDGQSLSPVVLGQEESIGDRSVFWFFPKYARYNKKTHTWFDEWRNVAMHGPYKLIEYVETGRYELFNLDEDPVEEHDLSETRPDLLVRMQAILADGKGRYGAPVPLPNPDYAP